MLLVLFGRVGDRCIVKIGINRHKAVHLKLFAIYLPGVQLCGGNRFSVNSAVESNNNAIEEHLDLKLTILKIKRIVIVPIHAKVPLASQRLYSKTLKLYETIPYPTTVLIRLSAGGSFFIDFAILLIIDNKD